MLSTIDAIARDRAVCSLRLRIWTGRGVKEGEESVTVRAELPAYHYPGVAQGWLTLTSRSWVPLQASFILKTPLYKANLTRQLWA